MEAGINRPVALPPVPLSLPVELRDYLGQVSQLVVELKGQVTQLLLRQIGGPDGSLSRQQAMQLLGVKHAKFNLIREQLTQAPSAGCYPRYTYESCRQWLLTSKRNLSRAEVEQMIEYRLTELAGTKRK
ncbi:hypothetical protein A6C57_01345 [Fibrella sp. ES10-3-2-2]|nr:hypothetical protein A6C57_01345 [Fibrella sp. ES10-3-2-2]